MKALVLKKYGASSEAFELRDLSEISPSTLQVRIKSEGFGLNFADVMARRGLYRDAPPLPCVLGYDAVGTIDQVGDQVDPSLIGKRVVAFTRFGAYAEYCVTDSRAVAIIPDDLSLTAASALATQYCTAYYAAIERANIAAGEYVLIHAAAGGVGTALIQLCKSRNCKVIALSGNDSKFDYLKSQGADYCINYKTSDYVTETKKILKGNTLDVAFNSVAGSTYKKDLQLLGVNGRSVLYGLAERSGKKWGMLSTLRVVLRMGIFSPIRLMMKTQSLIGLNMLQVGDEKPQVMQRCLAGVMNLLHDKKINPQVGKEFPITQFAAAHDWLESGNSVGKIAIRW